MADGNVTIVVSHALFKVHRHILSRDGSAFSGMFSSEMGGGEVQQEGSSDENPIQLQGDTPEEFRDFLWCLYALPQEIAIAMSPQADIARVVNVLRMANKYHFITTEAWATATVTNYLQYQLPAPLPTATLVKISEAAVLVDDEALLDTVRQRWRSLIGEKKELALSLITVERLGLRDLQGLAYQAMLLKGREVWNQEKLLTRNQRIRLFTGYHNIAIYATTIGDHPPLFDHSEECPDSLKCQRQWESLWRIMNDLTKDDGEEALLREFTSNKLDLMSRSMMLVSILQALHEQPGVFQLAGLNNKVKFRCVGPALDATTAFSRKLQEDLMDFFEDVC